MIVHNLCISLSVPQTPQAVLITTMGVVLETIRRSFAAFAYTYGMRFC